VDRWLDPVHAVKKGKKMKRTSGRLSLALALLTLVGLTVPALAAEPPKGMVAFTIPSHVKPDDAASYPIPLNPPAMTMKLVGGGNAVPIGKFTTLEQPTLRFGVDGAGLWTEAVGVFTAENGDTITYQYKGLVPLQQAAFVITGGTGRFKGVTGSGTMTWADDATTPGFLVCTFTGFMSEPPSAR
jgi:hypothetical protein